MGIYLMESALVCVKIRSYLLIQVQLTFFLPDQWDLPTSSHNQLFTLALPVLKSQFLVPVGILMVAFLWIVAKFLAGAMLLMQKSNKKSNQTLINIQVQMK